MFWLEILDYFSRFILEIVLYGHTKTVLPFTFQPKFPGFLGTGKQSMSLWKRKSKMADCTAPSDFALHVVEQATYYTLLRAAHGGVIMPSPVRDIGFLSLGLYDGGKYLILVYAF